MQLEPIGHNATISTLEIAQLTGKNHADVMRDTRKTLEEAGISESKFAFTYTDTQNKQRPCYNLPRFECDLVVSGYSVKYRAAIIKRWHELEAKESAPVQFALPANMAEALRLAADSIEKLEAAEMKLLEVAPKVKTYNEIMNSDGLFNFREVAGQLTALGFGSNTLVKKLVDAGVLYYDSDNKIRCYQFFTAKGYFKLIERSYEVKEFGGKGTGEFRVSATLKVTPAGVEFINRKLAA